MVLGLTMCSDFDCCTKLIVKEFLLYALLILLTKPFPIHSCKFAESVQFHSSILWNNRQMSQCAVKFYFSASPLYILYLLFRAS